MNNGRIAKANCYCQCFLLEAALVGYSEFPTALLAAARENFTAVFGFHALAEAVFVFTGAAGWLVCTFHRLSIRIVCCQKLERKGNTTFQKSKNHV